LFSQYVKELPPSPLKGEQERTPHLLRDSEFVADVMVANH
jgi:hypothetical protein